VIDRWDLRPYPQRLGDAISQLANVALFNGMTDESLSGRAYRNTALANKPKLLWRAVAFCAEAFFWPIDRGEHCYRAFWEDIARSRLRSNANKLDSY